MVEMNKNEKVKMKRENIIFSDLRALVSRFVVEILLIL